MAHNVAIYRDASAIAPLFKGDLVTGPSSTTYHVPGLAAGTCVFRCDLHPQMQGAFAIK